MANGNDDELFTEPEPQTTGRSTVLRVAVGDFFRSKIMPTKSRVKAYSEPPGKRGHYITTFEPGSLFGPAEHVLCRLGFVTVQLAGGYWSNVGTYREVGKQRYVYRSYAKVLSAREVDDLKLREAKASPS